MFLFLSFVPYLTLLHTLLLLAEISARFFLEANKNDPLYADKNAKCHKIFQQRVLFIGARMKANHLLKNRLTQVSI